MKNMSAEKRRPSPEKVLPKTPSSRLIPAAILLASCVLACVILFWNRAWDLERQEFMPGEPALRSYFSPVSFTYVDEVRTDASRLEKLKTVPPVYRIDPEMTAKIRARAESFFKILREARIEKDGRGETRWKELPFRVPTSSLDTLLSAEDPEQLRLVTLAAIDAYLSRGILTETEKATLSRTNGGMVLLVSEDGQQEAVVSAERIVTLEDISKDAASALPSEMFKKKGLRNATGDIIRGALLVNLGYDEVRTAELRKKEGASVPPALVMIKKNELIVQRGMLVTDEIKQKLDQVLRKVSTRKQQVQIFTSSFLVLLLYVLTAIYFAAFEPAVFRSRSLWLLFHTVVLLALVISKVVAVLPDASIYLMPTALAALLLTLLIHSRAGVMGGIMMTVMSGFLSGFRMDLMIATLFASLAATFLSHRVRKRSHFLRIGLGIGGVFFLVIAGCQVMQNTPWRDAAQFGLFGFLNALMTAVGSYLLLPFLEHFFDALTDVTLLELSDLNHPLIRKMMVEAPGTYHHSLVVSSLAEDACEKIGAHSLLARVGCYFHDIGKLEKPEFFTENQGHLYANHHDVLPPRISFEIIINHVRDGVRIARKYRLKRAIVDFIREHQGTGVVYYFFKKAMDMAAPAEQVLADDFRYPGPKPQTRETAVALLADSAEAASRSLVNPTPDSIQQLVRKIINDKFIDGQLDECELTLRDLHKIQASFVRNLTAMFHTRMKYPLVENPLSAPDLFGTNQFSKFRADK